MKIIVILILAGVCSMCIAQATYPCINDPWNQTSVTTHLDRQVTCNPTTVQASLNPCLLNASCFNVVVDFKVGDCFGVIINGRLVFNINPLGGCGASVTVAGKIVTYTYIMRQVNRTGSGAVSAIYPYDFHWTFKCEYNLTQVLSSVALQPTITNLTLPDLVQSGTFDTTIGLYDAATGGTAYVADASVPVFTQIYLRVSTTVASYYIQILAVWATKTANAGDTDRYNLLSNGCPATNSHFVNPIANYNVSTSVIEFRAFAWKTGGPKFWIHVNICICCINIQKECPPQPNCGGAGRRRRALHASDMQSSTGKTQTVSLGPLSILPNQP